GRLRRGGLLLAPSDRDPDDFAHASMMTGWVRPVYPARRPSSRYVRSAVFVRPKERPFVQGHRLLAARSEAVAGENRLGDVGDLPIGSTSVFAKQVEGVLLVQRITLHQDPLGPLGDGSSAERALERVVLGETLQRDVDRALHLLQIRGVGDVG